MTFPSLKTQKKQPFNSIFFLHLSEMGGLKAGHFRLEIQTRMVFLVNSQKFLDKTVGP